MTSNEANVLVLTDATDEQLTGAFAAVANTISYYHADDSGREWPQASALKPKLREIELHMRKRGMERPTGNWLLTDNDRIDWDTGEWSPGWAWKKQYPQCPHGLPLTVKCHDCEHEHKEATQ